MKIVVVLAHGLVGQIRPQPWERVERGDAETGGTDIGGMADLTTELNMRWTTSGKKAGQKTETGGNREKTANRHDVWSGFV